MSSVRIKIFDSVKGYIDSLPVFMKVFPNQQLNKQEDLTETRVIINDSVNFIT